MRRLPVYLLLDTSGSMHGEPIEAVKNGVQTLLTTLKQDPYALETAYVSVITFDSS
ncbi:tellurium resistance protein TerY, partial [Salmonella enterica subsp. enterica serovar Typhimurium]|nr:tellurium resistance protein TerY [Salmonella enterica subsp. enterica serovar Typhimurium]